MASVADSFKKMFAVPPDPRKVDSGTSYQAAGTVTPVAGSLKEIGSAKPVRIPDVVPQFSNRQQMLRVFKEMEDGDTTFDVSMRAVKTPIMGSTFFMQPFDEKPDNLDIAEFCRFNIFEGTSKPFVLVLDDVLRVFNDGWSIIEHVWEEREWAPRRRGANRKKYTMLKKLSPRPAMTIKEVIYDDNGGPVNIVQNAVRADNSVEEVPLDIAKLLIFTIGGVGGDLMGKPLGRTAYNPWYFKKELYKIDAIGHERNHLGVPVWTLAEGFNDADVSAAKELVRNMRTNENTGIVEPPGYVFRFEEIKGQRTDIMPSIDHHDSKILLNVLAQFLMLGLTGGGGRATSGAHVDMFQKSVRYIADYICGVFNLYLIPKLVGYNFDTSEFPQMKVRNIGETKDLQMWASAHANLITSGAITLNEETENWYRENMDMPFLLGPRPAPVPVPTATPTSNGKGAVDPAHPKSGTGSTKTDPGFEQTKG